MTGAGERYSCDMLIGCTGYFSYENPYEPKFPGQENFSGTIVHPQKWTPEHDRMIEGKRVALIGSGATAVTIFPGIKVYTIHWNTGSAISVLKLKPSRTWPAT